MKKEYTKPNMKIVSFNLEENITEGGSTLVENKVALQNKNAITTINY